MHKILSNIAVVAITATIANPVSGETLYRSPPWIVSTGHGLEGQPDCSITAFTPLADALMLTVDLNKAQIAGNELMKDYSLPNA